MSRRGRSSTKAKFAYSTVLHLQTQHNIKAVGESLSRCTENTNSGCKKNSRCALPFLTASSSAKLLKFDLMQVQVNIEFDQLLKIVKRLPSGQLKQLRAEIEKEPESDKSSDLETLLLNGPIATKKQLETIANNRKAINQWRTK